MKKNYNKIWVADSFAKKLKIEATQNDKTIIDYTRELAESDDTISNKILMKKKRGIKFVY